MNIGRKKKPLQRTDVRQRRSGATERAPSAYSYHAQRSSRSDDVERQHSNLTSKRSKLLTFEFWLRRSGFVVLLIVVVASTVSILSLSLQPRIVLLGSGNTFALQDASVYQAAAATQLSSSIWNRNKITINTGLAASRLAKQHPEISKVNITLPLIGHRPIYYIEASEQTFVLQSTSGSYILDSKGKALLPRDAAPEAVANGLPIITDQTGLPVKLGQQVLSGASSDFVKTVIDTLAAKNITVESLTLPAGKVQELDVRVSGKPYSIRFDMHDSGAVRQQIGTYLALPVILINRIGNHRSILMCEY